MNFFLPVRLSGPQVFFVVKLVACQVFFDCIK